jgi:hypothetical protein
MCTTGVSLLSVVAASRNDGHGLHLLPRMQVFIDGLADQVGRFGREVELILVDWNPPNDRPPLSEVLTAPAVEGFSVRVITVPPEVHSRLSVSSKLSFFQMIAKNVAIRRANGHAVLATNIDILLADDLFLDSTGGLSESCVYRSDRVDIAFDPAITVDPQVLRSSAAIRVNQKTGIYYPGVGQAHQHVRGGASLAKVALKDPADFVRRALRWDEGGARATLMRYRRAYIAIFVLPQLHLNACGDFTLMTRDSWAALRGYPEWEMFSWNLDSILLYQAAAAGFSFKELDGHPAFHLDHASGWSIESQTALFERLNREGIPVLADTDSLEVAYVIWKGRRNSRWRTNLPGWGMAGIDFPEASLQTVRRAAHRMS